MGVEDSPALPRTSAEYFRVKQETKEAEANLMRRKVDAIESTMHRIPPKAGQTYLMDGTLTAWKPLVGFDRREPASPWPDHKAFKLDGASRANRDLLRRLPRPTGREFDAKKYELPWIQGEGVGYFSGRADVHVAKANPLGAIGDGRPHGKGTAGL